MAKIGIEDGEEAVERKVTKDGRVTGLTRYAERRVLVVVLKKKEEDKKKGGEGDKIK